MKFLEVVVALAVKEFEHRRPKLTSRERLKINSRTHLYLFLKASRVLLRGGGYARNRWLNTLYGIVWETKYGRFTTLNIPKCEHFPLLMCPLRFLVISAMRRLGYVQSSKTYMFLPWTRPQLGGLHHLETFTWQIVTPADRVILPGRPGYPPWRVTPPIV